LPNVGFVTQRSVWTFLDFPIETIVNLSQFLHGQSIPRKLHHTCHRIHTGGANSMQHASLRTTSLRLLTPGSPMFRELPKLATLGIGYIIPVSGVLKNTGAVSFSTVKLENRKLTIADLHISTSCQRVYHVTAERRTHP
jgi:hypothetical protein